MNPRKSLTSRILSYGTVSVTNIQQQGLMELQPGCCILSQKLSPHPYLPFLIPEQKNYHLTGSCLMWCQYLRRLHCAMMFILFGQYHYSQSEANVLKNIYSIYFSNTMNRILFSRSTNLVSGAVLL